MPKISQNILVLRFSALGDVAMAVPVVRAVLEQNPTIHLTLVTPKFMHPLFPFQRLELVDFDKKNQHHGIKGLNQLFNQLRSKKFDAVPKIGISRF